MTNNQTDINGEFLSENNGRLGRYRCLLHSIKQNINVLYVWYWQSDVLYIRRGRGVFGGQPDWLAFGIFQNFWQKQPRLDSEASIPLYTVSVWQNLSIFKISFLEASPKPPTSRYHRMAKYAPVMRHLNPAKQLNFPKIFQKRIMGRSEIQSVNDFNQLGH